MATHRQLIDASGRPPDAFVAIDKTGHITYRHKPTAKMHKNIFDYMASDCARKIFTQALEKALTKIPHSQEIHFSHDGQRHHCLCQIYAIYDHFLIGVYRLPDNVVLFKGRIA
ncbi:MAG: hypothetical protein KKE62_01810 [Proteobacteria bacterium]|nr:hypothetical protein [Pseudomonadota bacterium]MBU1387126.1 hypothetical protein [Pseudomonadota bacterium]MBU1541557.1 hypothetical protein [Pseudomonadota bacterium]MBU2429082.1 hypothetical protein [Pseudomonadota bacterium]MBU2482773.1 hypothetical protein [Pseudomonadota bacterium]